MSVERTLVLVKPDGVSRNLTGAILCRIEAKGYTLAELKRVDANRELLEQHYAEHVGKPFYEPLVEFMLGGPIVAAMFEGHRVIEGFRRSPAPRIRRRRRPAPSAATSAATGA